MGVRALPIVMENASASRKGLGSVFVQPPDIKITNGVQTTAKGSFMSTAERRPAPKRIISKSPL